MDGLRHGRKVAIKFIHPELAAAIGPDRSCASLLIRFIWN